MYLLNLVWLLKWNFEVFRFYNSNMYRAIKDGTCVYVQVYYAHNNILSVYVSLFTIIYIYLLISLIGAVARSDVFFISNNGVCC